MHNPMTTTTMTMLAGFTLLASAPYAADGTPAFRKTLAYAYDMLAKSENQGFDIEDSLVLEEQERRALYGDIVPHPRMDSVRFVRSSQADLMAEHARLNAWLNAGTQNEYPQAMAWALAYYDCWVEQQETGMNMSHNMTNCRAGYINAARQLPRLTAAVPVTKKVQVMMTKNIEGIATLYFDFDKATLRDEAKATLDAIRNRLETAEDGSVVIIGHTDRAGSAAYNEKLSRARANAVAEYLGLPASKFRIEVKSEGETRNAVPTADGVALEANRRVVVGIDAEATKTKMMKKTTY
ncbi:MAG: hypothetical protein COY40_00740 [Alphaproteobacteria bacterium CG_4_10_14_0_8_um_filter_53_9]|nr:MAG: hypothetical protein COY40_00740 [Alphaproteobacteria bacterium CG_4_10_14_0_8_um_filter_53_9]